MNILVICQYYKPEPFRHPDYCEELVKLGHNVDVVTGIPNYPMGIIYEGYNDESKKNEVINGVHVHRCYTIPRKNNILYRFLNYYSYAISSCRYINTLDDKYDVVLVNQLSPVMMACAGIIYKKKYNKKLVLYCLDLWPESLIAGHIKKDSFIYNIYHKISKSIYSKADKILVSSYSFIDYCKKQFNLDSEYLPQYSESIFNVETCKKNKDNYLDIMFAGNIGSMQSIDSIIHAANILKDNTSIRFHIVGDGSKYNEVLNESKDLDNITFYGRKSLEQMPEYYSKADVMIVSTEAKYTLPGKIQTYMAAGKPIIAIGQGEVARIVDEANCGLSCLDNQLANTIAKFLSLDIEQLGINSRNYYQNNFDRKLFMEKLEKVLYE